jgi:hypothetical protein
LSSYEFTEDWTEYRTDLWGEVLGRYIGVPTRMVEIGAFERRSAAWFLDKVLTHPDAHIVCVDMFAGGIEHAELDLSELEQRFDRNMAGHAPKVAKMKGPIVSVSRQAKSAAKLFGSADLVSRLMVRP